MTAGPDIRTTGRRQMVALSLFLLIQTLGTVFFVGDVIADLRADPMSAHFVFEVDRDDFLGEIGADLLQGGVVSVFAQAFVGNGKIAPQMLRQPPQRHGRDCCYDRP